MVDGTTLISARLGLLSALDARPGLDDVSVTYSRPKTELANEAMWFGDTADADQVRLAAMSGQLRAVEENYDFDVVIQVLTEGDEGDDEELALIADRRATALFGELQQTLALAPKLIDEVLKVEVSRWRFSSAALGLAEQGARYVVTVRVTAHLTAS